MTRLPCQQQGGGYKNRYMKGSGCGTRGIGPRLAATLGLQLNSSDTLARRIISVPLKGLKLGGFLETNQPSPPPLSLVLGGGVALHVSSLWGHPDRLDGWTNRSVGWGYMNVTLPGRLVGWSADRSVGAI
jgi:hypothetical protein